MQKFRKPIVLFDDGYAETSSAFLPKINFLTSGIDGTFQAFPSEGKVARLYAVTDEVEKASVGCARRWLRRIVSRLHF